MIVGERSLPDAITSHSSIKKERPCSIRAGNGRRVRLSRLGVLRVGRGRGQCQHKRDCYSRHDGLLLLRAGPTRGDTTQFRSPSGRNWAPGWRPSRRPARALASSAPPCASSLRCAVVSPRPNPDSTPRRAYSQFSAPPFWYSITRVSKKFFSFLRSIASDIHGNGFSVSSNTRESPNCAQRRLAMKCM
jgi:hypothetical protein